MNLNLVDSWYNIEYIKNKLKERQEFLILVNNKYFTIIKKKNFFKANKIITSSLSPMNVYYRPVNRIYSFWQNYDLEFFGINRDIVSSLNSEIVVSLGTGTVSGKHPTDFLLPVITTANEAVVNKSKAYTSFPDDDTHFIISQSCLVTDVGRAGTTEYINVFTGGNVAGTVSLFPYTNNEKEFPLFYSQILIQFSNPQEFI